MRRLSVLAGGVVLAALVPTALVLEERHPEESLANGMGAILALEGLTVGLLIAAALVTPRQRDSALLLATALAVTAQSLPLPHAGGPLPFTVALVLGGAGASLAGLSSVELDARTARAARTFAVGTVGICALWVGLVPALLFDPAAEGCFACPRNLVLLHGAGHARTDLVHWGSRAAAAASVALAVLLIGTVVARRARHWSQRAALVGAAVALTASAFAFWRGGSRQTWVVECAGLLLLGAAPLAEVVRARLERARIVDTVLRTVPSAEELRVVLAASAGDRELALVYPHAGGSVDGEGLPVTPAANGTIVTDVVRAGEVVARLRHGVLDSQAGHRLADSVHAAGLAIEHTSARARLRAQLGDLTASRSRIVEVADSERRRLERNLHDGAQQRLIALSVSLAAPGDETASAARDEVLAALEELRTIAHGIHPVSLSDGGIVASVRELAETSAVPLRVELLRLDRLPAHLESAAYRVVAECVSAAERYGDGKPVAIEFELTDSGLSAELVLPGVPYELVDRDLVHAADRVTAAAGRLGVTAVPGGTVVEVRL